MARTFPRMNVSTAVPRCREEQHDEPRRRLIARAIRPEREPDFLRDLLGRAHAPCKLHAVHHQARRVATGEVREAPASPCLAASMRDSSDVSARGSLEEWVTGPPGMGIGIAMRAPKNTVDATLFSKNCTRVSLRGRMRRRLVEPRPRQFVQCYPKKLPIAGSIPPIAGRCGVRLSTSSGRRETSRTPLPLLRSCGIEAEPVKVGGSRARRRTSVQLAMNKCAPSFTEAEFDPRGPRRSTKSRSYATFVRRHRLSRRLHSRPGGGRELSRRNSSRSASMSRSGFISYAVRRRNTFE